MARGGRKASPTTIASVLGSTMQHLGLAAKLREYAVRKAWPACVGEAIARRAQPERLMGATLYCNCESSPWITELTYQKASIIERLNAHLGHKAVSEIVFRIGPVKKAAPKKPEAPPPRPVTPEEEAFIEDTARSVKDPSLKALITRVMKKVKAGS